MSNTRVLVTGAGSGVGQGIYKSLKASSLPLSIVTADISPHNSALYRAEESVLIPRVEEAGALEKVISVLIENKIDVLMIGSEFDLNFFSDNKELIEKQTQSKIVVSPKETIEISDDKWLTYEFLKNNGLPHAKSFLPENEADALAAAKELGYPVLVKARKGTSNRNIHLVKDDTELKKYFVADGSFMIQEVIDIPQSQLHKEYTCSVFQTKDGQLLGPFTARRSLRSGNSWHVEVAPFTELYDLCLSVGKNLKSMGSLNIQLMVSKDGTPVPFEFNSRFSGTTAVRAHYGFNEPEMVIKNYILGEDLPAPHIKSGMAYRYLEEVFVDATVSQAETSPFPQGIVRPWY